jgi:hypothetical protein
MGNSSSFQDPSGMSFWEMMYHLASRYVLSWFEKDAFLREYLKDHTQRYFERRKIQMQALEYYDPRSSLTTTTRRSLPSSSSPKRKAITNGARKTTSRESLPPKSEHVEFQDAMSEDAMSDSETEDLESEEIDTMTQSDALHMYYMYGSLTSPCRRREGTPY